MRVHIVNYEEPRYNGILSKYAYKMKEELEKLGVKVSVSNKPNKKASINHHINYRSYIPSGNIDTLMVTHITTPDKLESIKSGMKTAAKGVCFSKETEEYLNKEGLKNLCTILPAHDDLPRKVIGIAITTNVYPDGCKREHMFSSLLSQIDCSKFEFFVMGTGWNLSGLNANINYLDHFDQNEYLKILGICDYSLYFGEDEGSMGILDAAHVGLKTIAPNTGFHKEIGIDYPFSAQKELVEIFNTIGKNKVADWTWSNYALAHKKLWEELVK